MNVQKVMLTRTLKQYGIFFAGVGVAMITQHVCERSTINDIKTEIMAKYPNKYNQIDKNSKDLPIVSRKRYWDKALNELNDSAINSKNIHKAYFDGSNRVKNNANIVKK